MTSRIDILSIDPGVQKALFGMGKPLHGSSLEPGLLDLLNLRVSQMNGCAYCIDMHSKDLRAAGESEQRLYLLDAWRESPGYSARERAALAWAEAVTRVTEGHVPDAVFEEVRSVFTEAEIVTLTLAVTAINTWNRFNIAFRTPAGAYKPGMHAAARA